MSEITSDWSSVEGAVRRRIIEAKIEVLEEMLQNTQRVRGDYELPFEMVSVDVIEEKIAVLRKELA